MNKSIYRNIYYVKETFSEFLHFNKKQILWSLLAVIIGVVFGICVSLNNLSNFTIINISDKTIISIFSGGGFLPFILSNILKYLFLVFLILIINNFSYIRFLSFLIFGYLAFLLSMDSVIIISIFNIKGLLYCLLGYILINLLLIFTLIGISIMCRLSCDCNGNSSKFFCYPYKNIILFILFEMFLILLLGLISYIFTNFIVIIV